jgi:hypothetical protein
MFIPIIARLDGISLQSRLELLTHAASNASTDVRYSLLKTLHAFAPHEVIPLLQTLSHDKDSDIGGAAQARLESLEVELRRSLLPSARFEMDIEEAEVFQMPTPETKSLSATVVNRGPAKPRLVLDVIADEE